MVHLAGIFNELLNGSQYANSVNVPHRLPGFVVLPTRSYVLMHILSLFVYIVSSCQPTVSVEIFQVKWISQLILEFLCHLFQICVCICKGSKLFSPD